MYFYKRNAIFIYTKKRFNIVYVRKSRGTKWKQKEKGDEEERERERPTPGDPHTFDNLYKCVCGWMFIFLKEILITLLCDVVNYCTILLNLLKIN